MVDVINREVNRLLPTTDPTRLNEDFLNNNQSSIPHRLQGGLRDTFLYTWMSFRNHCLTEESIHFIVVYITHYNVSKIKWGEKSYHYKIMFAYYSVVPSFQWSYLFLYVLVVQLGIFKCLQSCYLIVEISSLVVHHMYGRRNTHEMNGWSRKLQLLLIPLFSGTNILCCMNVSRPLSSECQFSHWLICGPVFSSSLCFYDNTWVWMRPYRISQVRFIYI